jgi:hypothetical protein
MEMRGSDKIVRFFFLCSAECVVGACLALLGIDQRSIDVY